MDLATILYTLIIKPLVLIFEVIFVFANRGLGNPGLCIIVLSLAMNLRVHRRNRQRIRLSQGGCHTEGRT